MQSTCYSAFKCNHTVLDATRYLCSILGQMAQSVASLLGKVEECGMG